MKKNLRYFMTLLLMMVASVGWADEESVTFSEKGYTNGEEISSYTGSYFSVTFDNGTNSQNAPKYYSTGSAIRVYGGNTFTVSSDNTITDITLTFSSGEGTNAIAANVGTYSNNTWTGSANSVTFTVQGATGHRRIAKIAVTYTTGGTPTCAKPTFSPAGGIYSTAQSVTLSTSTEGATIYYTLDGNDPTTSSNVYLSAIDVSETTTIKAMAVKADMDNSSVASATYTIVAHAGTEADPYTVADARAAIDAGTGINNVYATGIVSKVGSYNSKYQSITYWISADGKETSDQLEVYSGKGINGADFSSIDDILVGDVVTVYGNLKKFNDTYEFDLNNQLVSLTRPEKPAVTVSFNEPTTTVNISETVKNVATANVEDVTVVYSSSDESIATVNEEGVVTGVAAGTAIITASIAEAADYNVTKASYTITVSDPNPPVVETFTFAKVEDVSTLAEGDKIIIVGETTSDEVTTYYAMGEQRDNNRGAVSITVTNGETSVSTVDGVQIITLELEKSGNFWNLNTGKGYLYAAHSSKNYLKTEASVDENGNANATIYPSYIEFNGTNTRKIMQFNLNLNNGSPLFACYATASQSPVTIYKKVESSVETATITLNAACTDGKLFYGTYSNSSAFVVSDDIVVSEVGIVDGKLNVKAYETGATVPANTGVMVSATAGGDYTVNLSSEAGTSVLGTDNCLKATGDGITAENMDAANADCKFYRLTMHDGKILGFYWGNENGAAFALGANKAYLAVPASLIGAKEGFAFGETTGINNVNVDNNTNEKIFNLAGQQMKSAVKGVYIKNGRKYVK